MKILFILHYPPPVHGAANVGLQIKESKIINETFNCTYINLGTSKTIEEIGKRRVVKIFRYLKILGQILKNMIFNRPDLCYFSMTAKCAPFYKDASLAFVVKMFRVKVIYHFHNKGVSVNQNLFFDDKLYRFIFKNSKVILLSKYLYPDVKKYVDKNQVYFCSNGIAEMNVKKINTVKTKTVELLFLSNLIISKGIFVMLEACKILQQKEIPFRCTFVGGNGDLNGQEFQSEIDKLNLNNHVVYLGKKYGDEKEKIFADSDIFVHPTLNDCFPLVLLEAMQSSLPVVSTHEGGIPDILEEGHTGFLVPLSNANLLAEKLEILINNYELRLKMGKAGRKKYENEFTLDRFEHRLNDILQQVIESNKYIN